ncbi:MAG: hypothetical protein JSW07_23275 [bacterium]|nr:MAG: hypothetical protein JSW07_23275 [bacterium]
MKVTFVTPYNIPCGIATYSEKLIKALMKSGLDMEVISNIENHDHIKNVITKVDSKIIHVQHEFGLFPNTCKFVKLLKFIQNKNKKVVVTLHTTKKSEINLIKKFSDLIIVHNDSLEYPCSDKKILTIPHPIPDITLPYPKAYYRRKYGIREKSFVIGTTGFLISIRKIDYIVRKLSGFIAANKDIYINLVTSSKYDIRSKAIAFKLKKAMLTSAYKKRFLDRISIGDTFVPFQEYYERLSTLDLGFSYCPEYYSSSSGSVTEMVGCRIPLVVNNAVHFQNIKKCCWNVNSIDDISNKILEIYKQKKHRDKSKAIEKEIDNKSYEKIASLYVNQVYNVLCGNKNE